MEKKTYTFTTKGIIETIERDFAIEYKPFAKVSVRKATVVCCVYRLHQHCRCHE